MKDREPFDVEPLSDAHWERIERGIFERLDGAADSVPQNDVPLTPPRPRRRLWSLAGAALAGAAAVAAAIVLTPRRADAPATPSHIETGNDRSHVALGEATLDVGPRSSLVVSGDDARGRLIVLERGDVECEVTPRGHRPPFVVQSGAVRVTVVGTRFRVERAASGGSQVSVARGSVEVTSGDRVVEIRAGERWPADDEMTAATTPAPAPRRAEPNAPSATHVRPPSVPPVPAASPAPVAEEVPNMARTEAPSSREQFEAAARLESREPAEALERYRELARGDGPWAANALYAEGRLALDRGDRPRAEHALREYRARFPNGPNANDARDLLERITSKKP